ncbi:hypothetical protein CYMTET_23375 [Cymbomonas tetramitiformis]|uniref:Uncharacterized protein n=1 Tax=Cymbomonas tetramitiformis TaxID=36881 RepID=A0AAE0FYB3_9CHLO|nr:hypothetical protein CYMTET_23375 [Cymbomonas tetramitiformis]
MNNPRATFLWVVGASSSLWYIYRAVIKQPPREEAVSPSQASQLAIDTQGNTKRLALYEKMSASLEENGLDATAVEKSQEAFSEAASPEWPGRWPKKYDLPFPSVRLTVIPLDTSQRTGSHKIASAGAAVSREIAAALAGYDTFANPRMRYHASLFYLSHPNDVRVDPFQPSSSKSTELAVPSDALLERELSAVTQLAASTSPITLEVSSVVFTSSGTLLLLFTDATRPAKDIAPLDLFRQQMRSIFPGAPAAQPSPIVHCTLLRLISPVATLPNPTIQKIAAICSEWTAKLRGTTFIVDRLWHVHESEFSTLEGLRETIMLRSDLK